MSVPATVDDASATAPVSSGGLRRILWRVCSPWVSITLLALVFIHQSLGSAGYVIRQHFELNEMEWFNGWLSLALWSSICICLILASVLRIPWRWSRAGAHLTHLGVVSMVLSATWYFSHKIEGEAFLLRHYIDVQGKDGSCRLLPNSGYAQPFGHEATAGQAKVVSVIPHWPILSYQGPPQQAWAVMVSISLPGVSPFMATLIENHPELTQYTLEGRRPTSYLDDYPKVVAAAGTLSAIGADGIAVLPTPLTVRAKSSEHTAAGDRSLEITNITPDFPLLSAGSGGKQGTMIEWTLKTPKGQESGSSIVDQPTLTRFQRARVKQVPDARLISIHLSPAPCALAYYQTLPALWVRRMDDAHDESHDAVRAVSGDGIWHLPLPSLPRYHDHGSHVRNDPLNIDAGTVGGVHFTITGFTPYAEMPSGWVEDPTQPLHPLISVDFVASIAAGSFAKPLAMSEDPTIIDFTPLCWVHAADATQLTAITAHLHELFPDSADQRQVHAGDESKTRVVFISAPDDSIELWVGQTGHPLQHAPISVGKAASMRLFGLDYTVRILARFSHPRRLSTPIPVPVEQQQSRSTVGSFYSFIQVTAQVADSTGHGQSRSVWVPYSPFPHLPVLLADSKGDTPMGLDAPNPKLLEIPGIGIFELEYSRELLPLPGPLWMTGFHVPRRPGSDSPTEFFCDVGYDDGGPAPAHATIHMNAPLAWRGFFFFQASWDEASESFTVLGVGNRPGGAWMLGSAILLALGMAWSGISTASRRAAPAPKPSPQTSGTSA